jgi:hypothetical protein
MVLFVMQDGSVPEIVGEEGNYSVVRVRQPLADAIATNCDLIRDAVQGLIETYCHAFRVDFQLSSKAELPISKLCYMILTCSAHSIYDFFNSKIILLQTTRKEKNWKTEETLERAVVTLETEQIKGSNP